MIKLFTIIYNDQWYNKIECIYNNSSIINNKCGTNDKINTIVKYF